ncbi:hypothetical protein Pelo_16311 [Pelomyxa schiedti]|nr:hypothetical protein Pelo_16311 [Pelomyxa schiedti]
MKETPLYGERTKGEKALIWGTGGIVILFLAFSVALAVSLGIIDGVVGHFFIAAVALCLFGCLAILWRWYNDKEDRLAPKFRWLIVFLVGVIILTCICIQIYAWDRPEPPPAPIKCNYKMWIGPDTDTLTCITVYWGPAACIYPYCLFWIDNITGCCGVCNRTLQDCLDYGPNSPWYEE